MKWQKKWTLSDHWQLTDWFCLKVRSCYFVNCARWTAANQFSLTTLVDNTLANIVCKFDHPSFTQLGETNKGIATAHFHYGTGAINLHLFRLGAVRHGDVQYGSEHAGEDGDLLLGQEIRRQGLSVGDRSIDLAHRIYVRLIDNR